MIDACDAVLRPEGMLKFLSVTACALFALALGGCKPKSDSITSLQRKEAANLVSEAQFAMSIRDFARAEALLTKATSLEFDNGNYWVSLGSTRVRLGQRVTAKKAYEAALHAFEDAYNKKPTVAQPYLQQVYALALLGRADDARALLAKVEKKHGDDSAVRAFVQGHQLDAMLGSPMFKEVGL
jgi:tetratricopeptide (TPR) repeat protein